MNYETKANPNGKANSDRMKKAWETRRANMAAKEAAKKKEAEPKQIGFQLPGHDVQKEMLGHFLDYIDFAIKHKDSGVLNTERFKGLLSHIKPYLKDYIK